jgi:hypothetical protein
MLEHGLDTLCILDWPAFRESRTLQEIDKLLFADRPGAIIADAHFFSDLGFIAGSGSLQEYYRLTHFHRIQRRLNGRSVRKCSAGHKRTNGWRMGGWPGKSNSTKAKNQDLSRNGGKWPDLYWR